MSSAVGIILFQILLPHYLLAKNIKPDALSRIFNDPKEEAPDTILSEGSFLLLQTDLVA